MATHVANLDDEPSPVSRRESLRVAAISLLGSSIGMPLDGGSLELSRMQIKFYRALAEGGALVGTVELPESVAKFLVSAAGTRGQLKWYDGAQEVASGSAPRLCCVKLST